ncbi:hypothetical protein [Leptolyngbya sp. FACHB-261]|uniref:hypothetical protein n=1 Tax=Leptolyngbya sp. FACHB-261 TaxID=2692806 RepID=UPI001682110A|nr:hypothetical protein [Leptolyngbya sp. FACHB-261]MBD2101072.1 hypothetical protein [Leptolyngbya sp. FACHB-261]
MLLIVSETRQNAGWVTIISFPANQWLPQFEKVMNDVLMVIFEQKKPSRFKW